VEDPQDLFPLNSLFTNEKNHMKQNSKTPHMNKEGLIHSLAEISGLSKSDSAQAIGATIQSIQKGLKEKNEVRIMGFGTFGITERKAREGRNPKTGETIKISASKHPRFRAGEVLRKEIA
jgi:DNA-binding protein HU-beta